MVTRTRGDHDQRAAGRHAHARSAFVRGACAKHAIYDLSRPDCVTPVNFTPTRRVDAASAVHNRPLDCVR